jgi:NTE family protein
MEKKAAQLKKQSDFLGRNEGSRVKGLVLSGGGARGAYQVGVLKAVGEICEKKRIANPFQILTGVSAGAINATSLASHTNDFPAGARVLERLWSELRSDQVFRTDAVSLSKIGLQWMGELSLGGLTGGTGGRSLLDTSPLRKLIEDNLDFPAISDRIREGSLFSVGITAMDYRNSATITFVQGNESLTLWERARRRAEKTHIRVEHVLASSAIPLLFPPVAVDHRYFGDGCVRNQAPCSPALHLGAKKILVIGVRKQGLTADEVNATRTPGAPSVARIANVLLNSVLLDSVETDVERLARVNEFLERVPEAHLEHMNFRPVPFVFISPSEDIGAMAAKMSSRLPRFIRYLLKGLGPLEDASELISYLLFEPDFCQALIALGYRDGMKQQKQIEQFLSEP